MNYFSINEKKLGLFHPNINIIKWINSVCCFGTDEKFDFHKYGKWWKYYDNKLVLKRFFFI